MLSEIQFEYLRQIWDTGAHRLLINTPSLSSNVGLYTHAFNSIFVTELNLFLSCNLCWLSFSKKLLHWRISHGIIPCTFISKGEQSSFFQKK